MAASQTKGSGAQPLDREQTQARIQTVLDQLIADGIFEKSGATREIPKPQIFHSPNVGHIVQPRVAPPWETDEPAEIAVRSDFAATASDEALRYAVASAVSNIVYQTAHAGAFAHQGLHILPQEQLKQVLEARTAKDKSGIPAWLKDPTTPLGLYAAGEGMTFPNLQMKQIHRQLDERSEKLSQGMMPPEQSKNIWRIQDECLKIRDNDPRLSGIHRMTRKIGRLFALYPDRSSFDKFLAVALKPVKWAMRPLRPLVYGTADRKRGAFQELDAAKEIDAAPAASGTRDRRETVDLGTNSITSLENDQSTGRTTEPSAPPLAPPPTGQNQMSLP
jgi:hypothetical protein